MTRPTRKLTTILAADVVGFSKLMDQHEELTLKNLKTCRDIVDPIITEYGGRIFHTAGDSVIAEFASPVSSVEAAIEFQQILADRNKNVPEESQITFRVGIHLDDVIIEGDNIYGNGVNVAARLESICEPGCILVSRFVQEKIEKRIQLTINSLGKSELKNIEGEFSIFQINPAQDGETASPPAASPVPAKKEAPPTPEVINTKPRLLVLPFRNLNNDEENEYLVDGIVEDIITEFSMINSIEIISRHTAFNFKGKEINTQQVTSELGINFIATGSIRSAGSRIRISVELTDAATESALWSERFDRMMEDVFEIQDEIVRKVIVALVGQLEIASLARAKRKPTENLSSYEFLLRGKENHHKFSKEGVVEGLQMFDKSIDADPENAQAYAWKVCTLGQGMFAGYLEEPVEDLFEEAQKTLQKALDINPNDFECHRMFCEIYKSFEDFEKAELHGRKAYEMNPNDPRIVNGFGEYLLLTGDTEKGVELMIKAYELDPNGKGDSNSNKRLGDIVFACYVHGEYEKSLEYAEKIEKLTTNAWLAKITSLSALGKADDKEKEMNKFLESNADFSLEDHISKFHFQDKSVNETMIQLLN